MGMKRTVSTQLTEPPFISVTSMWYITGTEWYHYTCMYIVSSPGLPLNKSVTFDPQLKTSSLELEGCSLCITCLLKESAWE